MHEHGSAPRLHPAAPGHPTPPGTAAGRVPRGDGLPRGGSVSRAGHPTASHAGPHRLQALPPGDPTTARTVSGERGGRALLVGDPAPA
ncbi:hypothetical protein [Streptomyces mirabilis]|uniref:hypothetical protein n=1 Tax=Streptomyces mirabilis TaxID=68239 RepID=UPI00339E1252